MFTQYYDYEPNDPFYRIKQIEYRNYQFMGCYVNFRSTDDVDTDYRGREYQRITPASMGRLKDVINRLCEVEFETEDIYVPVIVAYPKRNIFEQETGNYIEQAQKAQT